MRNLTQYLVEKFKINSKTISKFNKEAYKDILDHFGLNEDDDFSNYVNEWVTKYNVNKIKYIADAEVLEEGRNAEMDEDIFNDFDTDGEALMKCVNELENPEEEYDDLGLTIQYNKNVIGYFSVEGGLYAWKTK